MKAHWHLKKEKSCKESSRASNLPSLLNPAGGRDSSRETSWFQETVKRRNCPPHTARQPHPSRGETQPGVTEQAWQWQQKPGCQWVLIPTVSLCPSKWFQRFAHLPWVWATCKQMQVFSYSATLLLASSVPSLIDDFVHHLGVSWWSFLETPQVIVIYAQRTLPGT